MKDLALLRLSASARLGKIQNCTYRGRYWLFISAGVGGEAARWGEKVCVLSACQLRVPFQAIVVWVSVEATYTKLSSCHHISITEAYI